METYKSRLDYKNVILTDKSKKPDEETKYYFPKR